MKIYMVSLLHRATIKQVHRQCYTLFYAYTGMFQGSKLVNYTATFLNAFTNRYNTRIPIASVNTYRCSGKTLLNFVDSSTIKQTQRIH